MKNYNPSFLYFLSGIGTATTINLITGYLSNSFNLNFLSIIFLSMVGLGISLILALLALQYEKYVRDVDCHVKSSLTVDELIVMKDKLFFKISSKVKSYFIIIFMFCAIGVLIPVTFSSHLGMTRLENSEPKLEIEEIIVELKAIKTTIKHNCNNKLINTRLVFDRKNLNCLCENFQ